MKQKYGVVYTPDSLSEFVATLLKGVIGDAPVKAILDPASGECACWCVFIKFEISWSL